FSSRRRHTRSKRDWSSDVCSSDLDRRRVTGPGSTMNRLYAIESMLTSTGAMADHRLRLRSSHVEGFARWIAQGLGLAGPAGMVDMLHPMIRFAGDWTVELVRDLQAHRGSSLVIAGDSQPPVVHALAHAMNHALGNVGKTVVYTDPVEANPVNQT